MVFVLRGVLSSCRPEGLNHMWNGTSDCALNQCFIAIPRESSFPDSHRKCAEQDDSLVSSEGVHVEISASDGLAVGCPSSPGASFAVVCSSRNCSLTGNCCSSDVSQELISLGSGDISKCVGVWFGKWWWSKKVSSSLVRCHSRERASATLLPFPANH